MKRSELKKIIKPLVKECVQETILNDGLLSNIVSEVMQGMGNQFLVENKEEIVPTMSNENSVQMEAMENRKRDETQAASPLGNKDPNDAGVDISGIMALGGKNWKALMG